MLKLLLWSEKWRELAETWARDCPGGEVIDFPVEVRSAALSG